MTPQQLHKKKLLLVGLGLTGASVARYLHANQLAFDVVDEKASASRSTMRELADSEMCGELTAELCIQYNVIVLSPGVPRAHPAIVAALEKGVSVIGDIELFVCVANAPIIAVTGSNGKSTVVSWLSAVLEHAGQQAVLCGNIGRPALDALEKNASVYVLELSSYQLESTQSLRAFSAVVLNISDDHMDRYASLAEYAKVKRRVYQQCEHRIFNLDDEQTHLTQNELLASSTTLSSAPNDISFTLSANSSARYRVQQAANESYLCREDTKLLEVSALQLPGLHNVANALAVLALLDPLALSDEQLREGLVSFSGLLHRTELVRERHGVRWYNDSKGTNIDACQKAIQAMNAPVVLIAGGQGKGADFTVLRDTVKQAVKALVLIGEDAKLIAHALEGTVDSVHYASTMAAAVSSCAKLSQAGDVVLLSPACASFDMFKNFEVRGEQFALEVGRLAA